MSGARLTAALECANDAGVRFTLRRPGDSHGASRLSAGAAASCASADRPASAVRAAPSEAVATPQAEGLVRAWGQVCFHTPDPRPPGVAPDPSVPRGKAIERRCRAAISHQRTGRGARGAVPPPARCPGSGAGSWGFEGGRSIPSPDRNGRVEGWRGALRVRGVLRTLSRRCLDRLP